MECLWIQCVKNKWDRVTSHQVQDSGFLWKQEKGKWNQGRIQKELNPQYFISLEAKIKPIWQNVNVFRIHSLVDRYLVCFHILAIMNSDALKICLQSFV